MKWNRSRMIPFGNASKQNTLTILASAFSVSTCCRDKPKRWAGKGTWHEKFFFYSQINAARAGFQPKKWQPHWTWAAVRITFHPAPVPDFLLNTAWPWSPISARMLSLKISLLCLTHWVLLHHGSFERTPWWLNYVFFLNIKTNAFL